MTALNKGAATTPPLLAPCGSSMTTKRTILGSSAGANPINPQSKRSSEYSLNNDSTFWAVPVFPATSYPAGTAPSPVPPFSVVVLSSAVTFFSRLL